MVETAPNMRHLRGADAQPDEGLGGVQLQWLKAQ